MKNFVITLLDNEKSVQAANRCISSGLRFNFEIEQFKAFTPHTCNEFIKKQKINVIGFSNNIYSREDNAKACFSSHFALWQLCAETNQEITIFEHDAFIIDIIPSTPYQGCISFGKPSYGKYNIPKTLGRNTLTSKRYFPGAHAYRIKPNAARIFIDAARLEAKPTDIFLNTQMFPFLEEFYPWPVETRETFTTIQKKQGCLAKHMYNEDYIIEDI